MIFCCILSLQGTFAVEHDSEHGNVDLCRSGLCLGEGRAQHNVLHPSPDSLLGNHHHDQHRLTYQLCKIANDWKPNKQCPGELGMPWCFYGHPPTPCIYNIGGVLSLIWSYISYFIYSLYKIKLAIQNYPHFDIDHINVTALYGWRPKRTSSEHILALNFKLDKNLR